MLFIELHCSSDSLVNKTSTVTTRWSTVFISTDCSQLHSPRVLHFPGWWRAVNSGSHDLLHQTTSRLHWTASVWYLIDSWSELTRDGPETETSPSNLGYQSKCLEGRCIGLGHGSLRLEPIPGTKPNAKQWWGPNPKPNRISDVAERDI